MNEIGHISIILAILAYNESHFKRLKLGKDGDRRYQPAQVRLTTTSVPFN